MIFRMVLYPALLLIVFSGCSSIPVCKTEPPTANCLTDCTEIPAAVENFMQTRKLASETDEIEYLLSRIRTSGCRFYRNGSVYEGDAAVKFLRWKMLWYMETFGEKIETDEDFVAKILSGSKKTGLPYLVIFPDGKRFNASQVLQNEMNGLKKVHPESDQEYAKRVSSIVPEKIDTLSSSSQSPSQPTIPLAQRG